MAGPAVMEVWELVVCRQIKIGFDDDDALDDDDDDDEIYQP